MTAFHAHLCGLWDGSETNRVLDGDLQGCETGIRRLGSRAGSWPNDFEMRLQASLSRPLPSYACGRLVLLVFVLG